MVVAWSLEEEGQAHSAPCQMPLKTCGGTDAHPVLSLLQPQPFGPRVSSGSSSSEKQMRIKAQAGRDHRGGREFRLNLVPTLGALRKP